jgi:hypothetical protein
MRTCIGSNVSSPIQSPRAVAEGHCCQMRRHTPLGHSDFCGASEFHFEYYDIWNVPLPICGRPGMHFGNLYNPDFINGQWIGIITKGRHHRECKYKESINGKAFIMAMSDAAKKRSNISIVTQAKVTEIIREDFRVSKVEANEMIYSQDTALQERTRKTTCTTTGDGSDHH